LVRVWKCWMNWFNWSLSSLNGARAKIWKHDIMSNLAKTCENRKTICPCPTRSTTVSELLQPKQVFSVFTVLH
jgi:hypothetical protein